MKITGNLQYLVLFYCLPYNTLYHLRDWLHGVKRFALSECILLLLMMHMLTSFMGDFFFIRAASFLSAKTFF